MDVLHICMSRLRRSNSQGFEMSFNEETSRVKSFAVQADAKRDRAATSLDARNVCVYLPLSTVVPMHHAWWRSLCVCLLKTEPASSRASVAVARRQWSEMCSAVMHRGFKSVGKGVALLRP